MFTAGRRRGASAFLATLFLLCTVIAAFDTHDLLCPAPKCSICELKKVYKASPQKDHHADLFASLSSWVYYVHPQIEFLPIADGPPVPARPTLPVRSGRAPPRFT